MRSHVLFFIVLALVALALWDMLQNGGELGFALERAVEGWLHQLGLQ